MTASLCLTGREDVAEGLRRIFQVQLRHAGHCISKARLTDREIHNARKLIRRARATLQLLRPALAHDIFGATNVTLRDISRPLGQVRDSKVLFDVLGALRERNKKAFVSMDLRPLVRHLQSQRRRARRTFFRQTNNLPYARAALRRLQIESRQWRFEMTDRQLVEVALQRIYRKARRSYVSARKDASDERLHDWRKQVKHLWYGLEILAPLRPRAIDKRVDRAHELADDLGDNHDLAVLSAQIESGRLDARTAKGLTSQIGKRRQALQDHALSLGKRLLARKPKRFIRVIG